MTETAPKGGGSAPHSPYHPSDAKSRTRDLERWIERHRSVYTGSALEASAIEAGYTREEFEAALALVEARAPKQEALRPIRSRARRVVLVAYGLTWLVYAIAYLTRPVMYGLGPLALSVVTIALGIGLAGSWDWTRRRHPDPAHFNRAMAVLLSLPMVLLLVFGGTCLPSALTS